MPSMKHEESVSPGETEANRQRLNQAHQDGGEIGESTPVAHLPPKPFPRSRTKKRQDQQSGSSIHKESNATSSVTEEKGEGHPELKQKCDNKENDLLMERTDAMATAEVMKPRAETPIVQGVMKPKVLVKANMNARNHGFAEGDEDESNKIDHELAAINEKPIQRSDSKRSGRLSRVNVSSRVDLILRNDLFKKYLGKKEDVLEKLSYKQGRLTPGGGMKQAFSNLDLRNIDPDEKLNDPLNSSFSGGMSFEEFKKINDIKDEAPRDDDTVSNPEIPLKVSSPVKHRRHISIGNSNDLQDLEHELAKRHDDELKGSNLVTEDSKPSNEDTKSEIDESRPIAPVRNRHKKKFNVPSFSEFRKLQHCKLVKGQRYVERVVSMRKKELETGEFPNGFKVRESANIDCVKGQGELSEEQLAKQNQNSETNVLTSEGLEVKGQNSVVMEGQRSSHDLHNESIVQQTCDSSPSSVSPRSTECNNIQQHTEDTDNELPRGSSSNSERDCGLIPEQKMSGNKMLNDTIEHASLETDSKDVDKQESVSPNSVLNNLPPKVLNDASKQRIILRACRKRRMPQPAPRTSIGNRPKSVSGTKGHPVLTKSLSLDNDRPMSVVPSNERVPPVPARPVSASFDFPTDRPHIPSPVSLSQPKEENVSFDSNSPEKSPEKTPTVDGGTFYFPGSPILLDHSKSLLFTPRDSPSLLKGGKDSPNIFVFPEPAQDRQDGEEDSSSSASSGDRGENSRKDSDGSDSSKQLLWFNSSLDDIFKICDDVICDKETESNAESVHDEDRDKGESEIPEPEESPEAKEVLEAEENDTVPDSSLESAKNFVFRSSSDVSDSNPQALRKRRERKERPYKSDPFTGAATPSSNKFPYMPGKLRHTSSGRDDGFPEDFSLEEVDEMEEVNWDEMEGARRLRYRLSNISDASTDSGVIGQEGSQEAPPSPTDTGSSFSYSGSVRNSGADNPETKERSEGEVILSPTPQQKKKIHERKETILEIRNTEDSYGRDLKILKEHFYRPMKTAGLLSAEQVDSIFLNLEELISINFQFTAQFDNAIETARENRDEELNTVNVGHLFMESTDLLMAFENYCINQSQAAVLLESLEREKELLRIFLQVSQDENPILRRMPLKSFLILPVQRIMRYPMLLERVYKATSSESPDKCPILEARTKIEEIVSHINAKTKRGGTIKYKRKGLEIFSRQIASMEKSEFSKMAVEALGWTKKDVCEVMTCHLQVAFVTEQNSSKRSKNLKFSNVHGILVTLGEAEKSKENGQSLLFPSKRPVIQAAIVLAKEKNGKYSTVRDPFMLNRCIVNHEPEMGDSFELVDVNKDLVVFKGDDGREMNQWLRNVKQQTLDLGTWRRRRNALPNIMIKHLV